MPMRGKTVVVTGATDGIGAQTALELAAQGAQVVVHGRSQARCDEVQQRIVEATGNEQVLTAVADFAELRQVRSLADDLRARLPRLDVLVNNAGLYARERRLTVDGLELTFQVNHAAPFLLTRRLLDLLGRSAPARVVNVSSVAHLRGRLDLDDLTWQGRYEAYWAYASSKLCNVLFTRELARRLDGRGVTTNALHPGVIGTKLLRAGFNMGGDSLQRGAATSVYLASSPEVARVSGRYFDDCREAEPSSLATDDALAGKLWDATVKLVGEG